MHFSHVFLATVALFIGSTFAMDTGDAPKPAVKSFGSYAVLDGTATEVLENIQKAYSCTSTSVAVVKALYTEERVIQEELVDKFKAANIQRLCARKMHLITVAVIEKLIPAFPLGDKDKFDALKSREYEAEAKLQFSEVIDEVKQCINDTPIKIDENARVDAIEAALGVLVEGYTKLVDESLFEELQKVLQEVNKIDQETPATIALSANLEGINEKINNVKNYFAAIADKKKALPDKKGPWWHKFAVVFGVIALVSLIIIIVIVRMRRAKASQAVDLA